MSSLPLESDDTSLPSRVSVQLNPLDAISQPTTSKQYGPGLNENDTPRNLFELQQHSVGSHKASTDDDYAASLPERHEMINRSQSSDVLRMQQDISFQYNAHIYNTVNGTSSVDPLSPLYPLNGATNVGEWPSKDMASTPSDHDAHRLHPSSPSPFDYHHSNHDHPEDDPMFMSGFHALTRTPSMATTVRSEHSPPQRFNTIHSGALHKKNDLDDDDDDLLHLDVISPHVAYQRTTINEPVIPNPPVPPFLLGPNPQDLIPLSLLAQTTDQHATTAGGIPLTKNPFAATSIGAFNELQVSHPPYIPFPESIPTYKDHSRGVHQSSGTTPSPKTPDSSSSTVPPQANGPKVPGDETMSANPEDVKVRMREFFASLHINTSATKLLCQPFQTVSSSFPPSLGVCLDRLQAPPALTQPVYIPPHTIAEAPKMQTQTFSKIAGVPSSANNHHKPPQNTIPSPSGPTQTQQVEPGSVSSNAIAPSQKQLLSEISAAIREPFQLQLLSQDSHASSAPESSHDDGMSHTEELGGTVSYIEESSMQVLQLGQPQSAYDRMTAYLPNDGIEDHHQTDDPANPNGNNILPQMASTTQSHPNSVYPDSIQPLAHAPLPALYCHVFITRTDLSSYQKECLVQPTKSASTFGDSEFGGEESHSILSSSMQSLPPELFESMSFGSTVLGSSQVRQFVLNERGEVISNARGAPETDTSDEDPIVFKPLNLDIAGIVENVLSITQTACAYTPTTLSQSPGGESGPIAGHFSSNPPCAPTASSQSASNHLPPPPLLVFPAQIIEDAMRWKNVWIELSLGPHSYIERVQRDLDLTISLYERRQREILGTSVHVASSFPLTFLGVDPGMGSFRCEAAETNNEGLGNMTWPYQLNGRPIRPTMAHTRSCLFNPRPEEIPLAHRLSQTSKEYRRRTRKHLARQFQKYALPMDYTQDDDADDENDRNYTDDEYSADEDYKPYHRPSPSNPNASSKQRGRPSGRTRRHRHPSDPHDAPDVERPDLDLACRVGCSRCIQRCSCVNSSNGSFFMYLARVQSYCQYKQHELEDIDPDPQYVTNAPMSMLHHYYNDSSSISDASTIYHMNPSPASGASLRHRHPHSPNHGDSSRSRRSDISLDGTAPAPHVSMVSPMAAPTTTAAFDLYKSPSFSINRSPSYHQFYAHAPHLSSFQSGSSQGNYSDLLGVQPPDLMKHRFPLAYGSGSGRATNDSTFRLRDDENAAVDLELSQAQIAPGNPFLSFLTAAAQTDFSPLNTNTPFVSYLLDQDLTTDEKLLRLYIFEYDTINQTRQRRYNLHLTELLTLLPIRLAIYPPLTWEDEYAEIMQIKHQYQQLRRFGTSIFHRYEPSEWDKLPGHSNDSDSSSEWGYSIVVPGITRANINAPALSSHQIVDDLLIGLIESIPLPIQTKMPGYYYGNIYDFLYKASTFDPPETPPMVLNDAFARPYLDGLNWSASNLNMNLIYSAQNAYAHRQNAANRVNLKESTMTSFSPSLFASSLDLSTALAGSLNDTSSILSGGYTIQGNNLFSGPATTRRLRMKYTPPPPTSVPISSIPLTEDERQETGYWLHDQHSVSTEIAHAWTRFTQSRCRMIQHCRCSGAMLNGCTRASTHDMNHCTKNRKAFGPEPHNCPGRNCDSFNCLNGSFYTNPDEDVIYQPGCSVFTNVHECGFCHECGMCEDCCLENTLTRLGYDASNSDILETRQAKFPSPLCDPIPANYGCLPDPSATCQCNCITAHGVAWMVTDNKTTVIRLQSLQLTRLVAMVSREILRQQCSPLQWEMKCRSFHYALPFFQEQSIAHFNVVITQVNRPAETSAIGLADIHEHDIIQPLASLPPTPNRITLSVPFCGSPDDRAIRSFKKEQCGVLTVQLPTSLILHPSRYSPTLGYIQTGGFGPLSSGPTTPSFTSYELPYYELWNGINNTQWYLGHPTFYNPYSNQPFGLNSHSVSVLSGLNLMNPPAFYMKVEDRKQINVVGGDISVTVKPTTAMRIRKAPIRFASDRIPRQLARYYRQLAQMHLPTDDGTSQPSKTQHQLTQKQRRKVQAAAHLAYTKLVSADQQSFSHNSLSTSTTTTTTTTTTDQSQLPIKVTQLPFSALDKEQQTQTLHALIAPQYSTATQVIRLLTDVNIEVMPSFLPFTGHIEPDPSAVLHIADPASTAYTVNSTEFYQRLTLHLEALYRHQKKTPPQTIDEVILDVIQSVGFDDSHTDQVLDELIAHHDNQHRARKSPSPSHDKELTGSEEFIDGTLFNATLPLPSLGKIPPQPTPFSVPIPGSMQPCIYRDFYVIVLGGCLFCYKHSRSSSPADFMSLRYLSIDVDLRALARGEFIFILRTPLKTITCRAKHIVALTEWTVFLSTVASKINHLHICPPNALRCGHGHLDPFYRLHTCGDRLLLPFDTAKRLMVTYCLSLHQQIKRSIEKVYRVRDCIQVVLELFRVIDTLEYLCAPRGPEDPYYPEDGDVYLPKNPVKVNKPQPITLDSPVHPVDDAQSQYPNTPSDFDEEISSYQTDDGTEDDAEEEDGFTGDNDNDEDEDEDGDDNDNDRDEDDDDGSDVIGRRSYVNHFRHRIIHHTFSPKSPQSEGAGTRVSRWWPKLSYGQRMELFMMMKQLQLQFDSVTKLSHHPSLLFEKLRARALEILSSHDLNQIQPEVLEKYITPPSNVPPQTHPGYVGENDGDEDDDDHDESADRFDHYSSYTPSGPPSGFTSALSPVSHAQPTATQRRSMHPQRHSVDFSVMDPKLPHSSETIRIQPRVPTHTHHHYQEPHSSDQLQSPIGAIGTRLGSSSQLETKTGHHKHQHPPDLARQRELQAIVDDFKIDHELLKSLSELYNQVFEYEMEQPVLEDLYRACFIIIQSRYLMEQVHTTVFSSQHGDEPDISNTGDDGDGGDDTYDAFNHSMSNVTSPRHKRTSQPPPMYHDNPQEYLEQLKDIHIPAPISFLGIKSEIMSHLTSLYSLYQLKLRDCAKLLQSVAMRSPLNHWTLSSGVGHDTFFMAKVATAEEVVKRMEDLVNNQTHPCSQDAYRDTEDIDTHSTATSSDSSDVNSKSHSPPSHGKGMSDAVGGAAEYGQPFNMYTTYGSSTSNPVKSQFASHLAMELLKHQLLSQATQYERTIQSDPTLYKSLEELFNHQAEAASDRGQHHISADLNLDHGHYADRDGECAHHDHHHHHHPETLHDDKKRASEPAENGNTSHKEAPNEEGETTHTSNTNGVKTSHTEGQPDGRQGTSSDASSSPAGAKQPPLTVSLPHERDQDQATTVIPDEEVDSDALRDTLHGLQSSYKHDVDSPLYRERALHEKQSSYKQQKGQRQIVRQMQQQQQQQQSTSLPLNTTTASHSNHRNTPPSDKTALMSMFYELKAARRQGKIPLPITRLEGTKYHHLLYPHVNNSSFIIDHPIVNHPSLVISPSGFTTPLYLFPTTLTYHFEEVTQGLPYASMDEVFRYHEYGLPPPGSIYTYSSNTHLPIYQSPWHGHVIVPDPNNPFFTPDYAFIPSIAPNYLPSYTKTGGLLHAFQSHHSPTEQLPENHIYPDQLHFPKAFAPPDAYNSCIYFADPLTYSKFIETLDTAGALPVVNQREHDVVGSLQDTQQQQTATTHLQPTRSGSYGAMSPRGASHPGYISSHSDAQFQPQQHGHRRNPEAIPTPTTDPSPQSEASTTTTSSSSGTINLSREFDENLTAPVFDTNLNFRDDYYGYALDINVECSCPRSFIYYLYMRRAPLWTTQYASPVMPIRPIVPRLGSSPTASSPTAYQHPSHTADDPFKESKAILDQNDDPFSYDTNATVSSTHRILSYPRDVSLAFPVTRARFVGNTTTSIDAVAIGNEDTDEQNQDAYPIHGDEPIYSPFEVIKRHTHSSQEYPLNVPRFYSNPTDVYFTADKDMTLASSSSSSSPSSSDEIPQGKQMTHHDEQRLVPFAHAGNYHKGTRPFDTPHTLFSANPIGSMTSTPPASNWFVRNDVDGSGLLAGTVQSRYQLKFLKITANDIIPKIIELFAKSVTFETLFQLPYSMYCFRLFLSQYDQLITLMDTEKWFASQLQTKRYVDFGFSPTMASLHIKRSLVTHAPSSQFVLDLNMIQETLLDRLQIRQLQAQLCLQYTFLSSQRTVFIQQIILYVKYATIQRIALMCLLESCCLPNIKSSSSEGQQSPGPHKQTNRFPGLRIPKDVPWTLFLDAQSQYKPFMMEYYQVHPQSTIHGMDPSLGSFVLMQFVELLAFMPEICSIFDPIDNPLPYNIHLPPATSPAASSPESSTTTAPHEQPTTAVDNLDIQSLLSYALRCMGALQTSDAIQSFPGCWLSPSSPFVHASSLLQSYLWNGPSEPTANLEDQENPSTASALPSPKSPSRRFTVPIPYGTLEIYWPTWSIIQVQIVSDYDRLYDALLDPSSTNSSSESDNLSAIPPIVQTSSSHRANGSDDDIGDDSDGDNDPQNASHHHLISPFIESTSSPLSIPSELLELTVYPTHQETLITEHLQQSILLHTLCAFLSTTSEHFTEMAQSAATSTPALALAEHLNSSLVSQIRISPQRYPSPALVYGAGSSIRNCLSHLTCYLSIRDYMSLCSLYTTTMPPHISKGHKHFYGPPRTDHSLAAMGQSGSVRSRIILNDREQRNNNIQSPTDLSIATVVAPIDKETSQLEAACFIFCEYLTPLSPSYLHDIPQSILLHIIQCIVYEIAFNVYVSSNEKITTQQLVSSLSKPLDVDFHALIGELYSLLDYSTAHTPQSSFNLAFIDRYFAPRQAHHVKGEDAAENKEGNGKQQHNSSEGSASETTPSNHQNQPAPAPSQSQSPSKTHQHTPPYSPSVISDFILQLNKLVTGNLLLLTTVSALPPQCCCNLISRPHLPHVHSNLFTSIGDILHLRLGRLFNDFLHTPCNYLPQDISTNANGIIPANALEANNPDETGLTTCIGELFEKRVPESYYTMIRRRLIFDITGRISPQQLFSSNLPTEPDATMSLSNSATTTAGHGNTTGNAVVSPLSPNAPPTASSPSSVANVTSPSTTATSPTGNTIPHSYHYHSQRFLKASYRRTLRFIQQQRVLLDPPLQFPRSVTGINAQVKIPRLYSLSNTTSAKTRYKMDASLMLPPRPARPKYRIPKRLKKMIRNASPNTRIVIHPPDANMKDHPPITMTLDLGFEVQEILPIAKPQPIPSQMITIFPLPSSSRDKSYEGHSTTGSGRPGDASGSRTKVDVADDRTNHNETPPTTTTTVESIQPEHPYDADHLIDEDRFGDEQSTSQIPLLNIASHLTPQDPSLLSASLATVTAQPVYFDRVMEDEEETESATDDSLSDLTDVNPGGVRWDIPEEGMTPPLVSNIDYNRGNTESSILLPLTNTKSQIITHDPTTGAIQIRTTEMTESSTSSLHLQPTSTTTITTTDNQPNSIQKHPLPRPLSPVHDENDPLQDIIRFVSYNLRIRSKNGGHLSFYQLPFFGNVSIGREKINNIVLDDNRVSRSHACITIKGPVCEFKDLGSSCGSRVNGASTRAATLRPNDVIDVGTTSLILQATYYEVKRRDIPLELAIRLQLSPRGFFGDSISTGNHHY